MTVLLTCPHCGFSKEVPAKDIPSGARQVICPRCRQRFPLSGTEAPEAFSVLSPDAPAEGGGAVPGGADLDGRRGTPWEDRADTGFWRGFFRTVGSVLFSPTTLFRSLSYRGGIGEPLAFGLLAGSVGCMVGLFWQFLLAAAGLFSFGAFLNGQALGPFTALVIFVIIMALLPLFVALGIFVHASVMHLLLRLVRGGTHGFEGTFRVISYSQAAHLWALVPFVGGWVGGLWLIIVQVIGLREVHETTYLRIFFAFLIPVAVLAALAAAILIPLFYLVLREPLNRIWS
jgi:hypothetical protein